MTVVLHPIDLTALRCWAQLLTTKKKIKEEIPSFVDIPYLLWQKQASNNAVLPMYTHFCVLRIGIGAMHYCN